MRHNQKACPLSGEPHQENVAKPQAKMFIGVNMALTSSRAKLGMDARDAFAERLA